MKNKFIKLLFLSSITITTAFSLINHFTKPNYTDKNLSYVENENYKYELAYQKSSLFITNNKLSFLLNNQKIKIPSMNYYLFEDINENFSYIQADTLANFNSNYKFLQIEQKNENYYLTIHYEQNNTIYYLDITLSNNDFSYFLKKAKITKDEIILNRLRISNNYIYRNVNFNEQKNIDIDYSNYFSNSNIINAYLSNYDVKAFLNKDDIINKIVPNELFIKSNKTLKIGSNYGFYINTIKNPFFDNFISDIVLFNINFITPNDDNNLSGLIKIEQIYQAKYNVTIDNNETIICLDKHYKDVNYYFNQVEFDLNVKNKNAKNYGDIDYNPTNDEGAFFIQTRLEKEEFTIQKPNNIYYHGLNINTKNYKEISKNDIESLEKNIVTYDTYADLQIKKYGKLIKNIEVKDNNINTFSFYNYVTINTLMSKKRKTQIDDNLYSFKIKLAITEDNIYLRKNNNQYYMDGELIKAFDNY